ncbi:hypothetical protein [Candidatus Pelagibacter bacterium nBUS_25]|uniref:hypothetical protein n=1 Tax=Candidatus Pelagibacter bacterium nBUS_25 TaxID=3374187 RepID=UPI003EBDCAFF
MVKKIKYLILFISLSLFISNNSFAEDNPDLNPQSSGGAKFVSIPQNAAKKFIKDKGFRVGLNKRADGSHLFITIGQGSVTTTANTQEIHDARYNAFRTAMQKAKAEYVKLVQGEIIKTSIEAISLQNTMPDTIAEDAINNAVGVDTNSFKKLKKLISLKLDSAMKNEGYDPAASDQKKKEIAEKVVMSDELRSFYTATSQSMIGGFQAWTVFEEADPGDRAQFTVIGLWSPKLNALADSIYSGNLDYVPKGTPKKPIEDQLPLSDPNKLLQSFGAQMYVNENGSRVIVGFGHASPLFEERKDALGQACEQAGLKADQQIVMFSKENVMYSKLQNEISKHQDFERQGQKLQRSIQGKDYRNVIKGQAEIQNFISESLGEYAIKDPRYNATDCVAIKMWSPEGVLASRKTKDLNKSGSSTENSTGNTIGKSATQGTTGSDDF